MFYVKNIITFDDSLDTGLAVIRDDAKISRDMTKRNVNLENDLQEDDVERRMNRISL